jgi:hypothetical protein
MKGKRKQMRKAILAEMGSTRPWLKTVEMLHAKGIPVNLIIHEANEYGKRKFSSPNAKIRDAGERAAPPL